MALRGDRYLDFQARCTHENRLSDKLHHIHEHGRVVQDHVAHGDRHAVDAREELCARAGADVHESEEVPHIKGVAL
eukprot:CAMPEP_0206057462 /NCGR_PEP_ID=MMETSP1466-20131121/44394_1 /ASSEMBLY_ACC=CAM_ASM_001126 /TAXON_ID=44452 /ORGANISM="Pavlova gyrans, Strain CCMP608" /LENGTH=75 /DNA_ID=CAMNT_0053432737 /DNA_START=22 /DNA_END=246 /DNA_ORIENTATION=+